MSNDPTQNPASKELLQDLASCLLRAESQIGNSIDELGNITSRGEHLCELDGVYERLLKARAAVQGAMVFTVFKRSLA